MAITKVLSGSELGAYLDYGNIESGKVNPLLPAVNPIPIAFVPAATGNATNRNEFVIDPAGANWFIDYAGDAVKLPTNREPIVQQFSGQFLLDPNEYNGWGAQGFVDNSNTADLGNVGAANLDRNAGGFFFPFPVKLTGFYASHKNSNGAALAWGWCFYYQTKTAGSNTVTTTFLRDESFNRGDGFFGLRDYSNTQNQETLLSASDFVDTIIPANTVIGVCVGAPTALTTNYYAQVFGGYFQFDRV